MCLSDISRINTVRKRMGKRCNFQLGFPKTKIKLLLSRGKDQKKISHSLSLSVNVFLQYLPLVVLIDVGDSNDDSVQCEDVVR